MKFGIKGRLVWSYLLLIILTVLMFESIILSALRFYYIGGVKQTLQDQGTMFISFYEEDISGGTLMEDAETLLQRYNFLVNAQVQLLDLDGNVIADTHSEDKPNLAKLTDVVSGIEGLTGYWNGEANGEKLLSVSQPIFVGEKVIGVIRLTTSIDQLNAIFKQNTFVLLGIGAVVIIIAALISYVLANTITKPLSQITSAAEQMASGKFSVRIPDGKNDELGKLANTLNFMAKEVERHERLKNEFIASVSHELRTPLTSVKGWAVTLESMSDDPFFKEGLDIISNESDRLSHLLGDLLDVSSLSSGKVHYKFEDVLLEEVLHQVVTQLRPRADRQGVKLEGIYSPTKLIRADRDRLKQVFINIFDNALKFTPKDGRITVQLLEKNQEAFILIKDTGEGIPIDELKVVKEKFNKGRSKGSGTGLGLAICQEIIQAHKGLFELQSEVGKGTTVEIKLPL